VAENTTSLFPGARGSGNEAENQKACGTITSRSLPVKGL